MGLFAQTLYFLEYPVRVPRGVGVVSRDPQLRTPTEDPKTDPPLLNRGSGGETASDIAEDGPKNGGEYDGVEILPRPPKGRNLGVTATYVRDGPDRYDWRAGELIGDGVPGQRVATRSQKRE